MWAEDYNRELSNIFVVQEEVGRAVADKLRGSLSKAAERSRAEVTEPDIYTLYLQARSKMRDRKLVPIEDAHGLARRVVAADSGFAPGHALLAELTMFRSLDHYGTEPPLASFEAALPHALKAIELAPQAAEGHAALGLLLQSQPSKAIGPLARAVSLDPGRAEVRLWLADALSAAGRNAEALEHYRALEEIEPLWQPSIALYTVSLVAAGQVEQARGIVDRFEQRRGRSGEATILRGRFAEMTGDLSEAVRLVESARQLDPQLTYARMLLSWYFHMLGMRDRAIEAATGEPLPSRLYLAGRSGTGNGRPAAPAWGQPDGDLSIAVLARARDWTALAREYDHWRRQRGEGCPATYFGGITAHRRASAMAAVNFALALRELRRERESRAILDCLKSNIARQNGGPIRHYSLSKPIAAFAEAQILAMQGDRAGAARALDRAIDTGWRGWFSTRLADYPALDPLKGSAEAARLQRKIDGILASERDETRRLPRPD